MASSRDLRRVPAVKPPAFLRLELPPQAHHLNGRAGSLKSLVARLDAGAIERLLQGLAGEHAKAVRNAGLLLRLADAARHFVVDGLVVRGLAAQQAAERDNRIHLPRFASVRAAAGISHAPGTRTTSISLRDAPLRSNASSAPSSRRSVITAFQRATTMANFIPSAERSPSTATGLPFSGSVHAQKLNANPGSGSTVKMRDFQCVSVIADTRSTASPPCARSQATAA